MYFGGSIAAMQLAMYGILWPVIFYCLLCCIRLSRCVCSIRFARIYLVHRCRLNSKKYAWSIVWFLTPRQDYVSDRSMSIDIFMNGKLLQSAGLVVSRACQVYFVCLVQCVVYNHATSQSSVSVCVIVKWMWSSSKCDRRVNVTSSSSWSFMC